MNFLYNTGISAYALAARLAACRSKKVRLMLKGQARSFGKIAQARAKCAPNGFDLWFHAASLGEFEQARPLIEKYRQEQPELKILLTFFSPSGYEVRKNYDKVDCVAYLPFDKPNLVSEFLKVARPAKAIFVKYEFWGNFLTQLKEQNIPVYLIDAIFRPKQAFFRRSGGMFRRMLGCYTHIFVQDKNSADLLSGIAVDNVTVAGDTRFDRVAKVMDTQINLPQISAWLNDTPFTIVAGSSWPQDEACYLTWLNAHTDVKAIIAPHEFDAQRLKTLRAAIDGKSALWTEVVSGACQLDDDVQALIIDTFGLLSSLYRFGNLALVGGGLGAGIHNINEAAVYGIPVVFGPNHHKFKEAADLIACKGAYQYTDKNTLATILDSLHTDPAALQASGASSGAYIRANLGATHTIYQALN